MPQFIMQDLTEKIAELEREKLNRKEKYQHLCREIITTSLQLGHSSDVIKKKLSTGLFTLHLLLLLPLLSYD